MHHALLGFSAASLLAVVAGCGQATDVDARPATVGVALMSNTDDDSFVRLQLISEATGEVEERELRVAGNASVALELVVDAGDHVIDVESSDGTDGDVTGNASAAFFIDDGEHIELSISLDALVDLDADHDDHGSDCYVGSDCSSEGEQEGAGDEDEDDDNDGLDVGVNVDIDFDGDGDLDTDRDNDGDVDQDDCDIDNAAGDGDTKPNTDTEEDPYEGDVIVGGGGFDYDNDGDLDTDRDNDGDVDQDDCDIDNAEGEDHDGVGISIGIGVSVGADSDDDEEDADDNDDDDEGLLDWLF